MSPCSAAKSHVPFAPRWRAAATAFLTGLFCAWPLAGETLRLPHGEVLVGRLLERTADTLVFESRTLGKVSVPAQGAILLPDEASAAGSKTSPAPASAPTAAPARESGAPGPGRTPPQSWVRQKLGLPPQFNGGIDVGIDMLDADVKVRNYRVEANFSWKTEKDEYATYHAYESMRVRGVQATKTHDEGARWIHHLPPRWMLLSQVDWRSDDNQGVDYRIDAVFIPAFYFWKGDTFSLLGGAGISHEWRKWLFGDTELASQLNYAAYQVMRLKLTSTLSLRQTFLGYMDTEDADNLRSVFDVSLRQRLSPGLSLILNYNRRHESNPAPRTVKDQDRVVSKIGYEF